VADHGLDDLPVLERLGDQVAAAARAAPRRCWTPGRLARRLPPRVLVLAALLVLPTAAVSAGATLLALRGAVIPAPRATAPEQRPAPGSSHVAGFTVADPHPGEARWTMRLATSRTGLECSTAGQVVRETFGIVGLDGRFRRLADGAADACSVRRSNAASLVGARIFDGRTRAQQRTVVSGVGGATLRSVSIAAAGRSRAIAVHAGGTFLAVYAGLPEDLAIVVRLRFADGHVERHPFGVAPFVFPDPDGGRAWRVEGGAVGGDPRLCVAVRPARERDNPAQSPAACGRLGDARRSRGVFFEIRRLARQSGRRPLDLFGSGFWVNTPPRLLVWGAAGADVASISVRGPAGAPRTGTFSRAGRTFAFMFGPRVRPGQVVVTVRFADGRTLERRASSGLVRRPDAAGGTP
jgi:hypothetical protein